MFIVLYCIVLYFDNQSYMTFTLDVVDKIDAILVSLLTSRHCFRSDCLNWTAEEMCSVVSDTVDKLNKIVLAAKDLVERAR